MEEMKEMSDSNTIRYQVLSAMIAVMLGSVAVFEPVLTASQVAIVGVVLKIIDSGINTYLRLITHTAIKPMGVKKV